MGLWEVLLVLGAGHVFKPYVFEGHIFEGHIFEWCKLEKLLVRIDMLSKSNNMYEK